MHPRLLTLVTSALLTLLLPALASAHHLAGFHAYEEGDYATALKEYRPLAEQGDADAQHNLGFMYGEGRGVPQDYKEAVHWYRRAAAQGHAEAQAKLGQMYGAGWGVPQDYKEAVHR